jgi:hypothetical protein
MSVQYAHWNLLAQSRTPDLLRSICINIQNIGVGKFLIFQRHVWYFDNVRMRKVWPSYPQFLSQLPTRRYYVIVKMADKPAGLCLHCNRKFFRKQGGYKWLSVGACLPGLTTTLRGAIERMSGAQIPQTEGGFVCDGCWAPLVRMEKCRQDYANHSQIYSHRSAPSKTSSQVQDIGDRVAAKKAPKAYCMKVSLRKNNTCIKM